MPNGNAVGVPFWCTNRVFSLTWPAPMQIYWNKGERLHKKRVQLWDTYIGRRDVMWKQSGNMEFTFSLKALSFRSRTSIRAHKKKILRRRAEIQNFSNTWNGLYTAENQEERLLFKATIFLFGVTHCENAEVQTAVFSKLNLLPEWKLWWRHCETILGTPPKTCSWMILTFAKFATPFRRSDRDGFCSNR